MISNLDIFKSKLSDLRLTECCLVQSYKIKNVFQIPTLKDKRAEQIEERNCTISSDPHHGRVMAHDTGSAMWMWTVELSWMLRRGPWRI